LAAARSLRKFLCRPTWTVARRIALNAPSFSQGPGIHGVEPEIVEQFRHSRFGGRIVAGDDERTAVLRSRAHAKGLRDFMKRRRTELPALLKRTL
jgi:hypothetical protein